MSDFSFSRNEHLKSTKLIDKVFREGEVYKKWPFRLHYLPCTLFENTATAQIAFSVPKRNFKRAVDRNRIKRQAREAYRLHKNILHDADTQFALVLVYSAREKLPYKKIEDAVIHLLTQLQSSLKR